MAINIEFLQSWLQQQRPVVDCRLSSEFDNEHLQDSANLPLDSLYARMHELPKKSIALVVIYEQEQEQETRAFFDERQFQIEAYVSWQAVKAANLNAKYFSRGASQTTLWQPAPFVKHIADEFLADVDVSQWQALDLACGSGRDAIYLAQRGLKVYGVDYSATAIERCRITAEHLKVTVHTLQADLEKNFVASQLALPSTFQLVVVCRYLHRPLFEQLKQWVAPGGMIAYQTFMQGAEKIGSPRNPAFLLQPGELAQEFADFDILCDEVEYLEDGRPVSNFVARQPVE
ncbi:methyltransferase domain-containing protein [Pleionea sp. CnH1-48]|uniref:methyltransferase domain-containing protein n=1 Tax=Pleionea sp. CnH1-48 TaxID=2954494 RepID=UPI0020969359|nr:methyltransferase domain-containing protein [Pleionea sp. CnH1-48]MCO7224575.1 methyltransferase domain-containing protein [Pleionea sp. CnH1-48]